MLMSDEDKEFLALLKIEPLRIENKRACDKLSDLNDEELSTLLSLKDTDTLEQACSILRPLYQKYKGSSGKRIMPEMIIRGIYFIIFREMTLILEEDKNRCAKERTWLSEDGKLRKRILPDCTNKVYKLLGERSSKAQERLGIQPTRDFTMLHYEPVKFHMASRKDALFREMFLNVSFWADNPMFIDLTGEDSILGDIYYCDREAVCCRDSIATNFYYALQLRYKEFCRLVKRTVDSFRGDMQDIVAEYQEVLDKRNMRSMGDLKGYSQDEYVNINNAEVDERHPTALTYPEKYEDIDLDLAVKYLVVRLHQHSKKTTEQLQSDIKKILQEQIGWLRIRLEKTIICWSGVEDTLSIIDDGNMRFQCLKKKGVEYRPDFTCAKTKHYTYYENFKDTVAREKDKLERELRAELLLERDSDAKIEIKLKEYEKNKDRRVKKGFLFFDFNVRNDNNEARAFADFVKRNECKWAFVCEREDTVWIEELRDKSVKIMEINKNHPYAQFLKIAGYRDTMIITNVKVGGIRYDGIKRILWAYPVKEELLKRLITVRDSQTSGYDFVEDTDEEER